MDTHRQHAICRLEAFTLLVLFTPTFWRNNEQHVKTLILYPDATNAKCTSLYLA